jgi:omega-6 fatty acid desaturase (delta-12 desaturase)
MSESADHGANPARSPELRAIVARFEAPNLTRSVTQIVTTILLFLANYAAIYWALGISVPLALALCVPAGGLVVRLFIIQHDCGHGALFRSRRLNDLVGMACSVLTFTPYRHWRRQHASHHGNWNNLDRRDSGADIYSACLTTAEYRALPALRRFVYRTVRHPIIAHFLVPPLVFLLLYRLPFDTPKDWRRERRSVHFTNLALLITLGGLGMLLGFRQVLLIQLPIIGLASIVGVWLFSLQHRFDGTVWTRQAGWNYTTASLAGSSCLMLPTILQWFTGNIGFHHIHHLSPRVPNYRLQACHDAILTTGRPVKILNWRTGLAATRLALWDETRRQMISFASARRKGAA